VYEVLLERSVERALKRLAQSDFTRILVTLKGLSSNPRPPGCKKLVGGERDWRVRVGDYRVLYEIDDAEKAVRILNVKHRRDAYR
jgi:mRNA interferase RelE/StbE